MTDLERRALLGDKQAQEECTEKGIVLPCKCGGKAKVVKRKFKTGFYPSGGTFYVHCTQCLLTTQPRHKKHDVINTWNTCSAPPIGRCGECKHSWNQDEYGYINCTNLHVIMKQDDFCSLFEPKERTDEQIHNPAD